MRAQWENEKNAIKGVQSLREEIEKLRHDISLAERDYNLEKAAELKHGRLPALERQLREQSTPWRPSRAASVCSGRRSPRRRSPTSSLAGRHPVTRLVEGERRSSCGSTRCSTAASWGRTRP